MVNFKELQGYLDYEFSTGVYPGKDYLTFQTKYINFLRKLCRENGWELVNVGRNHYCFSCFFKKQDKFVYLSIADVRFSENTWYDRILVRTAKNDKDYTGGQNQFCNLPNLESFITKVFDRKERIGA